MLQIGGEIDLNSGPASRHQPYPGQAVRPDTGSGQNQFVPGRSDWPTASQQGRDRGPYTEGSRGKAIGNGPKASPGQGLTASAIAGRGSPTCISIQCSASPRKGGSSARKGKPIRA